jgi:hypothetical protein
MKGKMIFFDGGYAVDFLALEAMGQTAICF